MKRLLISMVSMAIASGANAAPIDDLWAAIGADDAAKVEALVKAAPKLLETRDAAGRSPLSLAAYQIRPKALAVLRAQRTRPDFWEACLIGDKAAVQAALAAGQSPDAFAPDGFTPLGLAIFFRNPEIARLLMDAGANPNLRALNTPKAGPLHSAAARGDLPDLILLLERGADPNLTQESGFRAIHALADAGDTAGVAVLLMFGADPKIKSDDGRTAADFARAKGHTQLAERLARP